jgi:hypothetical protein
MFSKHAATGKKNEKKNGFVRPSKLTFSYELSKVSQPYE